MLLWHIPLMAAVRWWHPLAAPLRRGAAPACSLGLPGADLQAAIVARPAAHLSQTPHSCPPPPHAHHPLCPGWSLKADALVACLLTWPCCCTAHPPACPQHAEHPPPRPCPAGAQRGGLHGKVQHAVPAGYHAPAALWTAGNHRAHESRVRACPAAHGGTGCTAT
jgi:hypothetical protein